MLSQIFILDATDVARPTYRLAGTSLCERFGLELRGSNFLAHWETQSAQALGSLLRQALRLKQPLCLVTIGVTADQGMVEIETVLAPVSFGDGEPTRFVGMMQILGDATPLMGRAISFERSRRLAVHLRGRAAFHLRHDAAASAAVLRNDAAQPSSRAASSPRDQPGALEHRASRSRAGAPQSAGHADRSLRRVASAGTKLVTYD